MILFHRSPWLDLHSSQVAWRNLNHFCECPDEVISFGLKTSIDFNGSVSWSRKLSIDLVVATISSSTYLRRATARWSKQQSTSRPWPYLLCSGSGPLSRRGNLPTEASPWHQFGTVHHFTLSPSTGSVAVVVAAAHGPTVDGLVWLSGPDGIGKRALQSGRCETERNEARVAAGARGPRDNSRRRRDARRRRRRRCLLLLSVILPPSIHRRTDGTDTLLSGKGPEDCILEFVIDGNNSNSEILGQTVQSWGKCYKLQLGRGITETPLTWYL